MHYFIQFPIPWSFYFCTPLHSKRDVVFSTNAGECEISYYILKENKDSEKQNIYMILFFRRKVILFQTYVGVKKMAIFSTNILQCFAKSNILIKIFQL